MFSRYRQSDHKLRLINSVVLLFSVKANITTARECYVCGLGARNPFKNDGEQAAANTIVIPSCNEFERSDNIDRYVVTCPEHYAGCITQTDGQYTYKNTKILL